MNKQLKKIVAQCYCKIMLLEDGATFLIPLVTADENIDLRIDKYLTSSTDNDKLKSCFGNQLIRLSGDKIKKWTFVIVSNDNQVEPPKK